MLSTLSGGNSTTTMSFLLTTNHDGKYIRMNREPLFDQQQDFVAFTTLDENESKNYDENGGRRIFTDWYDGASAYNTLDFEEARIELKTGVRGVGKGIKNGVENAYDAQSYKHLMVTVTITGSFPSATIKPTLNLKNFLTIDEI